VSIAELEGRELELEPTGGGLWREALYRLVRNPGAIVGFVLIAGLTFTALFAPWLAPYDPIEQIFGNLASRGMFKDLKTPGASGTPPI